MKAGVATEMFVLIYQTTRLHIRKNSFVYFLQYLLAPEFTVLHQMFKLKTR